MSIGKTRTVSRTVSKAYDIMKENGVKGIDILRKSDDYEVMHNFNNFTGSLSEGTLDRIKKGLSVNTNSLIKFMNALNECLKEKNIDTRYTINDLL